jgi:tetratricopeptide (TPR) repeat protein
MRGCHLAAARAAALALVVSFSFAGVALDAHADEVEAARWYRDCMQLADTAPQRALDRAEARRKAEGGTPAGHCAAVALVRLERFADGAKRFEALAAETDRPDLRAALLDQAAGAWLLAGTSERAVRLLDAAVGIAPDDAGLRLDKAAAEAELGRYDRAVSELNRAIALDPNSADAFAFRASARRRLNEMDAAAADLEQALSLDKNHPEALLERGILRQLGGDRRGARADWERVVAVAPDTAAAEAAQVNLDALATGDGR